MLGRLTRSQSFARTAIIVLTCGLITLLGLALGSTNTTARAVGRVQAANARASTWDQLFDQLNLEQDLMHSYVATGDKAHQAGLATVAGTGKPLLARLTQQSQNALERKNAADTANFYGDYTAVLNKVAKAGSNRARLSAAGYNSELAAGTVRQAISKGRTTERVATARYLRQVNKAAVRKEIEAAIAFSVCLILLGVCTLVLVSHQRRLEYQAQHDSLTGLANRALFEKRTAAAIRSAQRRGSPVALLLIDLDRFKEINDTLGHHAGDVLLQQVARRLSSVVRGSDTVARLGGDEFAVLLPRVNTVEDAVEMGNRLFTTVLQPIDLDGHEIEVSSSIGVAAYPDHCDDPDHLLRYADIAMYTAKRQGLGAIEYHPSQNSYDPKQLTMSGELRHAIESAELVLHYQPQIDVATRRWRGVEALIRWQHPVRGLLSPAEFIPLAEQGGLIDLLTDWVLIEALDQFVRWREAGLDVPVAVNISAQSLVGDKKLAERVVHLLEQRGIPPARLTLEITERAVISNLQDTIALLAQIRARGVRLSIDDFGTGYSSMTHLQEMPIDELKIDRSFVARMSTESSGGGIVLAVLDLARNLGLEAVAEGVETEETLTVLAELGCEICQGYLFSRPLPAESLTGWLREHEPEASRSLFSRRL